MRVSTLSSSGQPSEQSDSNKREARTASLSKSGDVSDDTPSAARNATSPGDGALADATAMNAGGLRTRDQTYRCNPRGSTLSDGFEPSHRSQSSQREVRAVSLSNRGDLSGPSPSAEGT